MASKKYKNVSVEGDILSFIELFHMKALSFELDSFSDTACQHQLVLSFWERTFH